jgi:tetratricopeptide (TPR) repeat protein
MRRKLTHYDTLGIERDATEEQVRAAFRRLTLQHHPDRFSGNKRAAAEERFQSITEAFNVLSHPSSRDKYDIEISKGTHAQTMDVREISRRLAAKGSQCLRDGNVAEALENLKAAIDHDDDNARAHYFYGLALAKVASKATDALRHVERASTLEPGNATMKAEAAALALAAGMKSRAARLAEEALALDPTSARASEVLSQAKIGEESKSGGLFQRFRRRS